MRGGVWVSKPSPSPLFRLIINNQTLTKFICTIKSYFVRVRAHSFNASKLAQ